ncbi:TonB-dependent receptor [Asticcacaulis sp.]|uniref:TonB-dependent receptor n=1 Tax=Asticcacaulis sp. TaxID=1872648 RepID=UPI002B8101F3|nr:TonB-dependent receptor [Asticcacaulis sp.]HTM80709.1 TonB-dependent receptor [Asticcacaulis sp.]
MKSFKGKASALTLLKGGVSAVALTAMAATLITPAYAQDAAPATDDAAVAQEVVVVGVRRSLKTAQDIKKNADTIVDSITATDIGSFPDKSVAEALQRVAGITVTRFAAATDTAHFSAEPSGVLVRGLQQVRSEFNGRDVFSANSSRGLSWGDVSPELMAGVDTYKNQTADLIEGGIAGSINLRTRLPFDSKGQLIALSVDESYGDLAKQWTPSVSAIYSNRWDTELGEFGLMINAAHSDIATTSQGIQYGRIGIFCTDRPDLTDPTTCNENQFGNDNNDAAQHNFAYIPVTTTMRDTNFDRTRNGISAAAQWESKDKSLLATLQYNTSSYENEWHEHFAQTGYFDVWAQPLGYQFSNSSAASPLAGENFTFNDQGLFQTGVLTSDIGWWGSGAAESALVAQNDQGQAMVTACYNNSDNGWGGTPLTCQLGENGAGRRGAGFTTGTRYNHNEETTTDTSFNLRWIISDKLRANFDVQYVKANVTNYDIEVDINSFTNVLLDATGDYPKMTLQDPSNVNQSAGGLTNPNNYYYNSVMDHTEDSEGKELASRFDLQYTRDEGWIDTIKVGVRYADREQNVNWSTYNWKNISNTYSQNAATWNIDTPLREGGPLYHTEEFGNDFMHQSDLINQHEFVFFNYDTLESREALSKAMSVAGTTNSMTPTGIGSWVPICDRANEVANSCYTPAEIMDIEEESYAGYLQLKFGGNDKTIFGKSVTGNAGVRWVQTNITSKGGGVKFPDAFEYNQNNCDTYQLTQLQLDMAAANGRYPALGNCIVHHSLDDVAFRDGEITSDPQFPAVVNTTHINWLPSFNLKVQLDDTWLMRFAYSRAMSRPDMGYLRNYFYIQGSSLTDSDLFVGNPYITLGTNTAYDHQQNDVNNPTPTNCAAGAACSYTGFRYTASSGNPYLKATTADQYDITFENYFASVGSFSFDLFYKQFYDYVQNGTRQLVTLTHGTAPTFDANGAPVYEADGVTQARHPVTRDVQVTGPVNAEGASLKGFEVSYQRFFDFLPSPFDGLGIQANYTKIKNTGVKNAGLGSTSAGGGGGLGSGGGGVIAAYDNIVVNRLEGLSDDSYNLIGMYEKGPWAVRAAYNWRSKFLVTAADCCVGFPIWQKGIGYLDASIRYRVSDNVELSVQGSNLLDSDTVLMQQVDNRGTLLPNAWFKNDKRVQVGVRLKY